MIYTDEKNLNKGSTASNKAQNAYNVYKFVIDDDLCAICQQGFNQMCSECKYPSDCKPCTGKCKHTYHLHCVSRWLQNSLVCPMCRRAWGYSKMNE